MCIYCCVYVLCMHDVYVLVLLYVWYAYMWCPCVCADIYIDQCMCVAYSPCICVPLLGLLLRSVPSAVCTPLLSLCLATLYPTYPCPHSYPCTFASVFSFVRCNFDRSCVALRDIREDMGLVLAGWHRGAFATPLSLPRFGWCTLLAAAVVVPCSVAGLP